MITIHLAGLFYVLYLQIEYSTKDKLDYVCECVCKTSNFLDFRKKDSSDNDAKAREPAIMIKKYFLTDISLIDQVTV